MHQFGWLSERGGNFLNLLQKEAGTQKEGGGGGSNPGGNYETKGMQSTFLLLFSQLGVSLKSPCDNNPFYETIFKDLPHLQRVTFFQSAFISIGVFD